MYSSPPQCSSHLKKYRILRILTHLCIHTRALCSEAPCARRSESSGQQTECLGVDSKCKSPVLQKTGSKHLAPQALQQVSHVEMSLPATTGCALGLVATAVLIHFNTVYHLNI